MLFTFKSVATANLIMHEKSGKEILFLLGKNPEDQCGIITVGQLPESIKRLQLAVFADKAKQRDKNTGSSPHDEVVSLSLRAEPFIDMLEQAATGNEPVTWGT